MTQINDYETNGDEYDPPMLDTALFAWAVVLAVMVNLTAKH